MVADYTLTLRVSAVWQTLSSAVEVNRCSGLLIDTGLSSLVLVSVSASRSV